jgi:hypothetical protein
MVTPFLLSMRRPADAARVAVRGAPHRHGILPAVPAASPVTRRTALAAGVGTVGAIALAGCTSGSDTPGPSTPARPSADEVARRAAAGQEEALAAQSRLLATSLSAGRPVLAAVDLAAAAHAAHATALLAGLPGPGASRPATSGSPTATAGGTSTPTAAVPPTPSQLAAAQLAAAAQYQAALGPLSGPVARLIASVAASDASLAAAVHAAAR